jgi:hypothetical protein
VKANKGCARRGASNLDIGESNAVPKASSQRLRYCFLGCKLTSYVRKAINAARNSFSLGRQEALLNEVDFGVRQKAAEGVQLYEVDAMAKNPH